MELSRRELCLAFPGALLPAFPRLNDSAQQAPPLPSTMYPYEKLPVQTSNGAQFRAVLKGKLATGESVEVHETMLPVDGAPHPPHHHTHSEMWLIREGTVELTVNGKNYQLGPGSVGFVHSNDEHGISQLGLDTGYLFRCGDRFRR